LKSGRSSIGALVIGTSVIGDSVDATVVGFASGVVGAAVVTGGTSFDQSGSFLHTL